MFGLSPYVLIGGAAGWALAALMGWATLHEHGVAASQASRDQASYATAQAQITAHALAEQQAIDAKQLAQADRMRRDAERAVKVAQATVHAALVHASAANSRIRVIVRHEPPSACARQPIPAQILSQLNGH